MVRVLIVIPSLTKGGTERQLHYYLNRYDREKIDIKVTMLNEKISYPIPNDITIINLRYKRRSLGFYYRFFRLLLRNDYDVINSKISGVNEMVMIFCGIMMKPNLIVEIRNSGKRLYKLYRRMSFLLRIFPYKWKIICNNSRAFDEVKSFSPSRNEVILIKNGIDLNSFPMSDFKRERMISIGFLGRVIPIKNIETILKALGILKREGISFQFSIKGDQNEDTKYVQFLKDLCTDLDINAQVKWIEPSDNVYSYYKDLNILILASYAEGSPNVLLESISTGCIPFCSKDADTENLLPDDFTFQTKDYQELTDKLIAFLNIGEDRVEDIRLINRKKITEEYNVDRMVEQYDHFYKNCSRPT